MPGITGICQEIIKLVAMEFALVRLNMREN